MKNWKLFIPFAGFVLLAGFMFYALDLIGDGKYNPRDVPSPLIDKPAPHFSLPLLHEPEKKFTPEDMKGQVWLLNVWASWCTTCLQEHPLFVQLSRNNIVPIIGMDYKDKPEDGKLWLLRNGNPFKVVVSDSEGRIAIDYGVYGVPETYLIDKEGIIRYKHIGTVTPQALDEKILPLVKELQAK